MLPADDIKLLITSGEGYNAEFKLAVPSKVKELSEEICAFANAAGGVLLIGINDKNEIAGTHIDNAKRSAIQNSMGEISPHLSCSMQIIKVDGKDVGVIEVPSGPNKPYVLSGAIYVRIGPNTQKLTTAEQMRDFFQTSGKIYFEEMPCTGFSPDNMVDNDLLGLFKAEARMGGNVPDSQLFSNLKLYTNDQTFKNGAVLFFGKEPEAFMEKAMVRCVAFDGTDKRYIADDKIFGGNLYQQFRQAMQWLKGKLNVRYDIEGQGSGPRKEIWEIPETVFREAIINSLSHRDYYDKGAVTQVEVFNNRVEISNPGGLVSAIPDAEFGKRSHSRNPLIFGLFARMHLVEQVGSGIGRMRDLMHTAGLPEPVFQKEGMFTVIFPRSEKNSVESSPIGSQESGVKSGVKSRVKILNIIKNKPDITIPELSEFIGITKRSIEKQIAKLKHEGLLQRIGSDKSGSWVITVKQEGNG